MIYHRVELTDPLGNSMNILIHLLGPQTGTWQALDYGYVCYEKGAVNTGYYPTLPNPWLALYGGNRVDDDKLVLHLDDFLGFSIIPQQGKGWVYPQDYLLMQPGEVTWKTWL